MKPRIFYIAAFMNWDRLCPPSGLCLSTFFAPGSPCSFPLVYLELLFGRPPAV